MRKLGKLMACNSARRLVDADCEMGDVYDIYLYHCRYGSTSGAKIWQLVCILSPCDPSSTVSIGPLDVGEKSLSSCTLHNGKGTREFSKRGRLELDNRALPVLGKFVSEHA